MKLSSHIVFNILLSTITFSAFANKMDLLNDAKGLIVAHKRDIAVSASSVAVTAFLAYLATNEKVKSCVSKTAGKVSDFSKNKAQTLRNWWNGLSKPKKAAFLSTLGAGATAAYIYFEGPGVGFIKDKYNASAKDKGAGADAGA